MVQLTKSQAINLVGRLHIDIDQVQALVNVIFDPNTSATDKTSATQQVKANILNMYKLLNTACAKQGYTPPAATFTDQELAAMGIT